MRINEKLHEIFVVCLSWQGNRQDSRGGKFIQNDYIFFSSFRALQGVNLITQITSHIISPPQMRGKLGMVVLAGGLAQHNSEFSLVWGSRLIKFLLQPWCSVLCEPSICLCGFLVQANEACPVTGALCKNREKPSCFVSNKALSCQTL